MSPAKPRASVVIPSWNNRELLGKCLESLQKQSFKDFEIIVVENGSTDGSAEYVRKHFPKVILMVKPKNLGFAGGVNVGIRVARGEYVALLNNDAIADPDWLKNLIMRMTSQPKIGAVTSKILKLSPDGTSVEFDSTGDYYNAYGRPFPRGRGIQDTGQYDAPEEVFGASGGATLYRAAAFKQIGLFDEEFFAYYEDVDISFRLRLAGWTIWYEPTAIVRHLIGATSGGGATAFSRYHSVKNQWYVFVKDLPAPLFWKYLPRFIFLQLLFFGSSILTGLGWPYLKSVGRGFIMTPSMLIKRRAIQSHRQPTVQQLDSWILKSLPPGLGSNFYRVFGWAAKK